MNWESLILGLVDRLAALLTRKRPKDESEPVDDTAARQGTSAGEAARRASHGPFEKESR